MCNETHFCHFLYLNILKLKHTEKGTCCKCRAWWIFTNWTHLLNSHSDQTTMTLLLCVVSFIGYNLHTIKLNLSILWVLTNIYSHLTTTTIMTYNIFVTPNVPLYHLAVNFYFPFMAAKTTGLVFITVVSPFL